jgi:hypothetical protein
VPPDSGDSDACSAVGGDHMFFILLIATIVLWTYNLKKGWVL